MTAPEIERAERLIESLPKGVGTETSETLYHLIALAKSQAAQLAEFYAAREALTKSYDPENRADQIAYLRAWAIQDNDDDLTTALAYIDHDAAELATLRGQVEAVRVLVQDPSDKWLDLEEEDYDADGIDRWIYKATVRAALAPAPDEVTG